MAMRMKVLLAVLALAIPAHGDAFASCPGEPKGYTIHGAEIFHDRELRGHEVDKEGLFHLHVGAQNSFRWPAIVQLGNAWVCTQFSFSTDPKVQATAGLMFWLVDDRNFHLAVVSQNGTVAVWRSTDGVFTGLKDAHTSEVVGAAPDQRSNYRDNTLEVIVTGNRVQIILNDTRLMSVEGVPPKGKWSVGLYAEPNNGREYETVFGGMRIIELP